jgi:oligopeptide transport system permease protein
MEINTNIPGAKHADTMLGVKKMKDEELFRFIEFDTKKAESTASSGYSYWKSTFKVFMQRRSTRLILYGLILLLIFVLFQPYIPGQKIPTEIFLDPATGRQYVNVQPNAEFWFGTNSLGQDLWARIWSGTRTTMIIAFASVFMSTLVGITIGALWGYVRALDRFITEIYNVLNNIPSTVIRMLITYIMRPSLSTLIFVMCLTGWIGMAKWIRNLIIIIRDREYNLASRCLGTPTHRVIIKNLLPQIISVVMLDCALSIPDVIGSEVFLTYIGLGLPVDTPSLGNLINEGRKVMMVPSQQYQLIFPAIVVALITISFYALGNAFADASDPRNHV